MRDEEAWMHWGNYGFSAFQTVMAHFGAGLSGKRSSAKYIDEPVMKNVLSVKRELTEEEKMMEVDRFFAKENARRINWKRKHRESEVEYEERN